MAQMKIRIYDYEKVLRIFAEVKAKHNDPVLKHSNGETRMSFPGVPCPWTCNGKRACFVFIQSDCMFSRSQWTERGYIPRSKDSYDIAMAEFHARCDKEAALAEQDLLEGWGD